MFSPLASEVHKWRKHVMGQPTTCGGQEMFITYAIFTYHASTHAVSYSFFLLLVSSSAHCYPPSSWPCTIPFKVKCIIGRTLAWGPSSVDDCWCDGYFAKHGSLRFVTRLHDVPAYACPCRACTTFSRGEQLSTNNVLFLDTWQW